MILSIFLLVHVAISFWIFKQLPEKVFEDTLYSEGMMQAIYILVILLFWEALFILMILQGENPLDITRK